jgi:hypothetical protein
MDTKKQILGIYEELKGISSSMPTGTWFDDEGFAIHTNGVIDRLHTLCPEINDLNSYKIKTSYIQGRGETVDTVPTKVKLDGLVGRIRGSYDFDQQSTPINGHTFIQQQSQSQEQHQTIILELQERIIAEIKNHNEGTKERSFLEKLKSSLPTLSNTLTIISTILSIANDTGLSVNEVRKILGL